MRCDLASPKRIARTAASCVDLEKRDRLGRALDFARVGDRRFHERLRIARDAFQPAQLICSLAPHRVAHRESESETGSGKEIAAFGLVRLPRCRPWRRRDASRGRHASDRVSREKPVGSCLGTARSARDTRRVGDEHGTSFPARSPHGRPRTALVPLRRPSQRRVTSRTTSASR